ncbi:MAG: hypothetical protein RBR53_08455 [Desulforegulaceae bacterium]|nr:hypothetical protein [Desulforegulaceae bacterium]
MKNKHFFIEEKVGCLFEKFNLSCFPNDSFNTYFIKDRKTGEVISRELVLCLDKFGKKIHVSRFYPELNKRPLCKYLSAACFYILIQHFAKEKKIDNSFHISLDCTPEVFSSFYTKLVDFHFINTFKSAGRSISADSDFEISDFEFISMVSYEVFDENEFYFNSDF